MGKFEGLECGISGKYESHAFSFYSKQQVVKAASCLGDSQEATNERAMRCKNCGWPNKPNETNCVKCHAPLSNDSDTPGGFDHAPDEPLGKTVFEEDPFSGVRNSGIDHSVAADDESLNVCPKCGYPVRPGIDKCPNCKFQLGTTTPHRQPTVTPRQENSGTERHRPTRLDADNTRNSKPLHGGTVNPYTMNLALEPTFALKPIKRINERHELEEMEFDGNEVVLNRGNTEQNNPSITSRQQAVVSRIDGKWYIEDRSEQNTTFVQASRKIELHDGDIILLGNRLFEFHE